MRHLLIADNRDSFVYSLVELLRQFDECTLEIHYTEQITPAMVTRSHGLLLSSGPEIPAGQSHLTKPVDSYHTGLSILSVRLGHQALAAYYGAELIQLQAPLHGHTDQLIIEYRDELLRDIPTGGHIGRYHSWVVQPSNLPDTLRVTAYAQSDGTIVALRHRALPLWGVQFRPESYISDHGRRYLHNFIAQL